MKVLRLFAAMALVLAAAAVLTGCMAGDDGNDSAATTTMNDMPEMAAAVSTTSPSADLRVTLDRLLGEHALLAQFATQKGLTGKKDFAAIAAALDENSVELADAIGSVYGPQARKEFLDGKLKWRAHIGFFVDYTTGVAKKDKAAQKEAVGNLKGYIQSFSAFLAQATDLPPAAVRGSITEHVNQLKGQLDAYAAKRYGAAYMTLRDAYAHMFMTGDTLSSAISDQSPDKFAAGTVTQGSSDLRVTLGRLLGEHAILATVATQKGYAGEADFKAIAGALDRNSVELADAIGSVYGAEARRTFLNGKFMWRDHIGFFVDYTTALAKKDEAGQTKAVNDLKAYTEAFSSFLAKATGLPQSALRTSIQEHVGQLKGQIDAYAAADYETAYSQMRASYEHMWMTGDTLAGAIVKQSPDKFSS